jgi:hypothetical protein
MFMKLIATVVLSTALVGAGGATWKALSPSANDCCTAKASGESCYPGSATCCGDCGTANCECCFDGSPCCGDNCCPDGAACCSSAKGCCANACCDGTASK